MRFCVQIRRLILLTATALLPLGGSAPDLRASPIPLTAAAFSEVVRKDRVALGMPAFETLSDQQLEVLRHFIREQANLAVGAGSAP